MSETLDRRKATDTFTVWLRDEHRRVHAPDDGKSTGLMSRFEAMRAASALDLEDPLNIAARKTEQHLMRARMRLNSLRWEFDTEVAGRALSDLLKLAAGQQVKRVLAMSKNQPEFSAFATFVHLSAPDGLALCAEQSARPDTVYSMGPSLDELDMKIGGSLAAVTDRAQTGEDWGELDSPMVKAAFLGEVACYETTFDAIEYLATRAGGYDQVPLRVPAKDETEAPMIYPFQAL